MDDGDDAHGAVEEDEEEEEAHEPVRKVLISTSLFRFTMPDGVSLAFRSKEKKLCASNLAVIRDR